MNVFIAPSAVGMSSSFSIMAHSLPSSRPLLDWARVPAIRAGRRSDGRAASLESPFMPLAPATDIIATAFFGVALLHTFSANRIHHLARRWPRHAGLLHLLGEVEVVFGFWAMLLIAA